MSLLGLVPDYCSDSSSSSESDQDDKNVDDERGDAGNCKYVDSKPEEPQNNQIPLPLPTIDLAEISTLSTKDLNPRTCQTSSVFFNPYLAAEKQRLSVLEKHVHLSESKTEDARSKQVCFKFQKGRCRLGDKCKFFHGLINVPNAELGIAPNLTNAATNYEPDKDEDSWEPQRRKKRKTGISDSLVPPKRAMQAYEKQRESEKPWSRA